VYLLVFTIQEPAMQVQISARIKSSACISTSWPVLKAEHVSALVVVCWYLHMLLCIEGFARVCMCVHLPKT
jgi:hypothetical protein